jgi:hypothetical protein
VSEAQAQQPEWLVAWQENAGPQLPQKVGNPNWHKGMRSPNPKGRPPGQSKQSKLMQRMLEDAGEVVDAVMEKAKEGDPASASLVLSRILPALRSEARTVAFAFDPAAPVSEQIEAVLAAIASGDVPVDVGRQIIDAIGTLANVRATEELEQRIILLEAKQVA